MLFHTNNFYGSDTPQVMANVLRVFCEGMKVCTEIVLMACDGGLLEIGESVIALAGTAVGVDTAVVMTASTSTQLGQLAINEIICKPLHRKKR